MTITVDGSKTGIVSQANVGGNTIAFLGDSRVAQGGGSTTGSTLSKNWNFPFHVGNALMGQRMVDVGNYGNSGDRSDQILTRLPLALAANPSFLWIQCGTNDIFQGAGGVNDAGIFANIQTMAAAALNQGTRPILVTETGGTAFGGVAAKVGYVHNLNQRLREYAAKTPGVILFDLANVVSDPASTSLGFRTNYDTDGQHLSNLGGFISGQAFQTLMSSLVPAVQNEIVSVSDIYGNGGRQLLDNPLFATATGGTTGSGVTGSTPSGWTAQKALNMSGGSGTATATISSASNASGYGNDIAMACTLGAAGEQIQFTANSIGGRVAAGDVLQFVAEIALASAVNIKGVSIQLFSQVASTGYQPWDGFNTSYGIGPNAASTFTLATPPWTVPAGAIAYIAPLIMLEASAAGASGTMTVRRVAVKKRFAA